MNDSLSPRDGDVVITRASHSDPTYEVQIVPGPQQISFSRKEDAIAQARRLAKRAAVDAWYRDGETLTLVGRYRQDR
ncbi:MAG TPA: hypothetical protein VIK60_01100 [Vicinamibacterales bacterium]